MRKVGSKLCQKVVSLSFFLIFIGFIFKFCIVYQKLSALNVTCRIQGMLMHEYNYEG
jgi:hypothetical protein